MPAIDVHVAAVRTAVRRALRPYATHAYTAAATAGGGPIILVACSGGADSLALADAVHFVGPRLGLSPGLVTVDHGLQEGSAERASELAAWAIGVGFDPVAMRNANVAGRAGGPEAAAREARYQELVEAARAVGSSVILLGHTREDQAETVLLALVRGAGSRGVAAMPAVKVVGVHGDGVHGDGVHGVGVNAVGPVTMLRPLLDIARSQTHGACAALGLSPWCDPHNSDMAFTRTRARGLLQELVERLGPAVVANLARSAELAAADVEVIDGLAMAARISATEADGSLQVDALQGLPTAVRRAVLRGWARANGVPGTSLSHRHIAALDALITDWRGQRGTSLPGGLVAARHSGRLRIGS